MTTLIITFCLLLAAFVNAAWQLNRLKQLKLRLDCLNDAYDKLFKKYINAGDRATKLASDVEQLQTLNKQLNDDLIQREKECIDRLQQLKKAEEHIVILRYELQKISNNK